MDWNQKIRERTMIPAFFFGFHVPPFPRPPQLLDFLSFGSFMINDVNCNGNATKKKSSNPGGIQFCLSCPLRCLTTTLQRVVLFRDSLLPRPENGPEPSSGPFSGRGKRESRNRTIQRGISILVATRLRGATAPYPSSGLFDASHASPACFTEYDVSLTQKKRQMKKQGWSNRGRNMYYFIISKGTARA